MLLRPQRIEQVVRGMSSVLTCPLTVKLRKGYHDNKDMAHSLLPGLKSWGAAAVTLHGRTRQQRWAMPLLWPEVMRCCSCDPARQPHLLRWVRALHWPARKTLKWCSVHVRCGAILPHGC